MDDNAPEAVLTPQDRALVALVRIMNDVDPLAGRLFLDQMDSLARNRPEEAPYYAALADLWRK